MSRVEPTLLTAHIRRMVATGGEALTDAELVGRYAEHRDAAAFEVLVWRHGPMVWATCHRVLRHQHDTEDAFQATFLALARTARTLGTRQAIGGWLHRVAVNAALKLKAYRKTTGLTDEIAADAEPHDGGFAGVVDEELNRLPDRMRVAFVLCCLEGMTSAEAARQLGCPVGTVDSRLHAARVRLRDRLTRRGFGPTALAGFVIVAAPPAALVAATVGVGSGAPPAPAVAALATHAGRIMTHGTIAMKTVLGAVLALALAGTAWGLGTGGAPSAPPTPDPVTAPLPGVAATPPAPVVRAAPADAPTDAKKGDVNETAWGQAEDGLQVGVAFRPPGAAGQPARLVVQLRNVGREAVSVRPRPLWQSSAQVRPKDGGKPLQSLAPSEIGYVAVRPRIDLKAGQTVELGSAAVRPDDAETRKWVSDHPAPDYSTYFVAPGRYEANFADLLDDLPRLSTGTTSFAFGKEAKAAAPNTKPETVWGEPVNGLRAGLRAPKTALGRGESVEVELVLKNEGTSAVVLDHPTWDRADGAERLDGTPDRGDLRLGWASRNPKTRAETSLPPGEVMVRGRVILSRGNTVAPATGPVVQLAPGKYRVSVPDVGGAGDRLSFGGPAKGTGGKPPAPEWIDLSDLGTGVLEVTVTDEEPVRAAPAPRNDQRGEGRIVLWREGHPVAIVPDTKETAALLTGYEGKRGGLRLGPDGKLLLIYVSNRVTTRPVDPAKQDRLYLWDGKTSTEIKIGVSQCHAFWGADGKVYGSGLALPKWGDPEPLPDLTTEFVNWSFDSQTGKGRS